MTPDATWLDLAAISTAFLAGLLGSGHCFGMCGGIAAGLGAMSPGRAIMPAVQFNLARLVSYACLGLVAAAVLGTAADLTQIGRWLRVLTALMLLLIGLKFLFDFSGLQFIERGGAAIWSRIQPLAMRAGTRNDAWGRILLGFLWGFLPCGLVYSILVTAASTGQGFYGALIMLAFGIGTLPSMLGLTIASPALHAFMADRTVRRIIGFALVVLAIWSLVIVWMAVSGGSHHHH